MKNIGLLAMMVAILFLGGCNGNKKAAPVAEIIDNNDNVADTTAYGRCGESTAMHTLELITDKGDTLMYVMDDANTGSPVKGGLFAGDRLAVTGAKNADGSLTATNVINLTSLLGKWASIDKTFEICEGGVIISNVKEPRPLTDWKILNGLLVLSADTFDIYSLGPDSLYLENKDGIYGYKRMPKDSATEKK